MIIIILWRICNNYNKFFIAIYHALLKVLLHKINNTILTRGILKFEIIHKYPTCEYKEDKGKPVEDWSNIFFEKICFQSKCSLTIVQRLTNMMQGDRSAFNMHYFFRPMRKKTHGSLLNKTKIYTHNIFIHIQRHPHQ